MLKIAVIGTTSWGTTLGVIIARKGMQVRLWARTKKEATELSVNGPDANFFAGVTFPPQLLITSQLKEALADVKVVILAVPSQAMRQNIKLVAPYLTKSVMVVRFFRGVVEISGSLFPGISSLAPKAAPRIRLGCNPPT